MKKVILLSAPIFFSLCMHAADTQYNNLELFEDLDDLTVIQEQVPEPAQPGLYDRFVGAFIPQHAIAHAAGAVASEVTKNAAREADQFTKQNIALMDATMQQNIRRVDRAATDWADRVGDRFDQSIDRTQELAAYFAQNIAKTALVSIKGCFGAFLAYKNIMLYLEEQNQQEEGAQPGLITKSNMRLAFAVTGGATFVSACLLSYYWIR